MSNEKGQSLESPSAEVEQGVEISASLWFVILSKPRFCCRYKMKVFATKACQRGIKYQG